MLTQVKGVMAFGALIVVVAAGMSVSPAAQEHTAMLQGAWRTVEVIVPGATTRTLRPEATLAIFHGRHYSRVEVHAEQARPPLADQATASADELRAVWGPFVGEAGTFELSGNVITMYATVAKNPVAMNKGVTSVFTYQLDGDSLTLTQVRTYAGPVQHPVTVKLTRVE